MRADKTFVLALAYNGRDLQAQLANEQADFTNVLVVLQEPYAIRFRVSGKAGLISETQAFIIALAPQ